MGGYAFGGGSKPHSPAAARSVARGKLKSERAWGLIWTPKACSCPGERLVCVRYRYDGQKNCRHKTVELTVETVPWRSNARRARRRDEEMIAVRIACAETELRERAKRLGAIWRPQQRLWEMRWLDAKRLGIDDRVQST